MYSITLLPSKLPNGKKILTNDEVSTMAILKKYENLEYLKKSENFEYINDEHKKLCDCVNDVYENNLTCKRWKYLIKKKYKNIYVRYGEVFWELVFRDMQYSDDVVGKITKNTALNGYLCGVLCNYRRQKEQWRQWEEEQHTLAIQYDKGLTSMKKMVLKVFRKHQEMSKQEIEQYIKENL